MLVVFIDNAFPSFALLAFLIVFFNGHLFFDRYRPTNHEEFLRRFIRVFN